MLAPELGSTRSKPTQSTLHSHPDAVSAPAITTERVYGCTGEYHGIEHNKNWLRFPYDSTFWRSHYLHPHPYATGPQQASIEWALVDLDTYIVWALICVRCPPRLH
jgi:hypothetical protein